ncbi:MAG: hypothetical protein GF405_04440 [Candidatus Eisenbacteria bacterium]|nr:hypothetical protein [Candidatus Eisenbacteria bacterium]
MTNGREAGTDAAARAREAALRLLSVRARSRRELELRLARKSYDETTVSAVLDDLEAVGLIDDRSFAKAWADERARLRPVGPARLRHELLRKGVARDLVEETIDETYTGETELALARAAADRKTRGRGLTTKERARLMRFLLGRGFSREVANTVVHELPEAEEEPTA